MIFAVKSTNGGDFGGLDTKALEDPRKTEVCSVETGLEDSCLAFVGNQQKFSGSIT